MATISGTCLVGGAPPTESVYVDAYCMSTPDTVLMCGASFYDYAEWGSVSQIDGSYTIDDLVVGEDYQLVAGSMSEVAKPRFYDDSPDWGGGYSLTATLAPIIGIDFNLTPADGTVMVGSSVNCPSNAAAVMAYVVDELETIAVGLLAGAPDAPYAAYNTSLYAGTRYRIVYECEDAGWDSIAGAWYDGHACPAWYDADLVFGNATDIDLDFGFYQDVHLTVPAGKGPRFSVPTPSPGPKLPGTSGAKLRR